MSAAMNSTQTFQLALTGQALIEQPVTATSAAAVRLIAELSGAHLAAANFEGTLGAPNAWPVKMKTLHVAVPEALASLRQLGINAVGLANNHAFDLGQPGVMATRAGVLAAGFAVAGSGANLADASAPAVVMAGASRVALFAFDLGPQQDMVYAGATRPGINPLRIRKQLVLPPEDLARLAAISKACGHEQRMARRVEVGYSDAASAGAMDFFGIEVRAGKDVAETRYPDAQDLAGALTAVRAAAANTELVVASLPNHHWEVDWAAAPAWMEDLCKQLVDAGADVVFCHGSPVLQGMGFHRGRPIFYGLGNFIFHTARAPRYDTNGIDVWRSAVATLRFGRDRALQSLRVLPIRVGLPLDKTPGVASHVAPELLEGAEADEVIARFLARSTLDGVRVSTAGGLCDIQPPARI